MLLSSKGEARFFHHPRCVFLRKDFETVEWASNSVDIDKSQRDRTHASDAIGYFINTEFGLTLGGPDPALRFYK
jgi:hypothetical protein